MEYLQELNSKQILALQAATEKQIAALQESTQNQITAFEKQITEVTNRLADNSILLAEILGRELEKSLDIYGNAVKLEEARYQDLSEWKFLRTQAEKDRQLRNQWNRIQKIKQGYDYLIEKYNQVKNFLGIGHKTLNQ